MAKNSNYDQQTDMTNLDLINLHSLLNNRPTSPDIDLDFDCGLNIKTLRAYVDVLINLIENYNLARQNLLTKYAKKKDGKPEYVTDTYGNLTIVIDDIYKFTKAENELKADPFYKYQLYQEKLKEKVDMSKLGKLILLPYSKIKYFNPSQISYLLPIIDMSTKPKVDKDSFKYDNE